MPGRLTKARYSDPKATYWSVSAITAGLQAMGSRTTPKPFLVPTTKVKKPSRSVKVAAAFISHKLQSGETLDSALQSTLTDLDGFFTFVVGTKNGFGVVRDPIACKPAVMAETDAYVAFGSEYRALVNLPGIETARIWEPEPATVYFWER